MDDAFGDRMKMLEGAEAARRFMPLLPICARLDGKYFHNYTKDMARPYDAMMCEVMKQTTFFLVEETAAMVGYTQSDEISLVYYSPTYDSQVFFDGKIQKIVSVLASMCTARFNDFARIWFAKSHKAPHGTPNTGQVSEKVAQTMAVTPRGQEVCPPLGYFDCRAWQVPTLWEAANVLVWREKDATRNSVTMAAQTLYSHKELMGKTTSAKHEMLHAKGVNWNEYPAFFKRGTYFARRKVKKILSEEELAKIPERYRPSGEVERTEVLELDLPPLTKIANREQVLFMGMSPVLKEVEDAVDD